MSDTIFTYNSRIPVLSGRVPYRPEETGFPLWTLNENNYTQWVSAVLELEPTYTIETNVSTLSLGNYGSNAYYNIIEGPNRKIYFIPYWATSILVYDLETSTTSTIGSFSPGGWKFISAALAPNGNIYIIPADLYECWKIDTSNNTLTQLTLPTRNSTGSAFTGSVLANNGLIYTMPDRENWIMKIDPETDTVSKILIPGVSINSNVSFGASLGANGKIYSIPWNFTQIIEFDPETETFRLFGSFSGSAKWMTGALGKDGKIYCTPWAAGNVLVIDTNSSEATATTFGSVTGEYVSCILSPNGKIYSFPRGNLRPLEIDTDAQTVTLVGSAATTGTDAGRGCILASDGRVWRSLYNNTSINIWGNTTTLDENYVLSRYINNF